MRLNILFLTVGEIERIDKKGIYNDLIRELAGRGHGVYAVLPSERRRKGKTRLTEEGLVHLLAVKTWNITKTSPVEKVISTLTIEKKYEKAIKKFFIGVKFDLVLYATPPITFSKLIKKIKKRDDARSYLMLKDIFPQNAADLGMIKENGFVWRMFRKKEIELYRVSDRIGCMSPANMEFLLEHNEYIEPAIVGLCPNAIEVRKFTGHKIDYELREKHGIPRDKVVFMYGGNLGRPQGIDFLIKALDSVKELDNVFMLIMGSGTDKGKIIDFIDSVKPENIKFMQAVSPEEYQKILCSCDAGMIFLDYRFKIPNFPSRLLSYLEAGIPVLTATDPNTDVGKIIEDAGAGTALLSNDAAAFRDAVIRLAGDGDLRKQMGINGRNLMEENYLVKHAADAIEGRYSHV